MIILSIDSLMIFFGELFWEIDFENFYDAPHTICVRSDQSTQAVSGVI